jgi:hypothetical protein
MNSPKNNRAWLALDESIKINAHVNDKNNGKYKAKSTNIVIIVFDSNKTLKHLQFCI